MDYSSVPLEMTDSEKSSIPCLVCRSRKVRCDKTLPECRNCERLGVRCPRYNVDTQSISRSEIQKSAEDIFKAAGVEKRRVGSCEECRASKHRCTRTRPSCRRCLNKGLSCIYPDKHEKQDGMPSRGLSTESSPLSQSFQGSLTTQNTHGTSTSHDLNFDQEQFYSEILHDDPSVRLRLVEAFFDRSHPLRCLGFLQKQTFMNSLQRDSVLQDYGQPILYAVCALGARHLYLDQASRGDIVSEPGNVPGYTWAERARKDVLADIDSPTVNHVMAMVLLCDYGIRADQNSMVFVLVSFLYRVVRLLGLDHPDPITNPSDPAEVIQKDTQNRLVWACYFIDVFMATGVDKNTCWKDATPEIPLPSLHRPLTAHIAIPQHSLGEVETPGGLVPVMADLDLSALLIVIIRLRMTGLRLIRTQPSHLTIDIWDPSSPFLQTIQAIDIIYQNLPERYHLTDSNIPKLREDRTLGGVVFFHFLLHSVVSDITRPSLPGYGFPLAEAFQAATPDFRSTCQDRCRYHGAQITGLIRKGLSCGRAIFDDVFPADAALEAAKIQIIYASAVNQAPEIIQQTRENVDTTFYFFTLAHRGKAGQSQYIRTLLPLCFLFGFRDVAEPYRTVEIFDGDEVEVTGSAEIEHLSRFAPFRRARHALKARSTTSTRTSSSHQTQQSPALWDTRAPNQGLQEMENLENDRGPPLQPDYPNFMPPPGLAMDASYYQGVPGPIVPQMSGMIPPDMMVSQASIADYVQTADQMAGYLTWDTLEVPAWLNPGNMFPPG